MSIAVRHMAMLTLDFYWETMFEVFVVYCIGGEWRMDRWIVDFQDWKEEKYGIRMSRSL